MNQLPAVPINHAARAWATLITTVGMIIEALQHEAPQIQAAFPAVKWISPTIAATGFVWMTIQRIMDANKQAAA